MTRKKNSGALLPQALLGCFLAVAAVFFWGANIRTGDYFSFPPDLQAFFVIDNFFILPIYFLSCLGIILGKKEMEVSAMMSGLGIFASRLAFLIGELISGGRVTPAWVVIFFLMPIQAWIFTIYLAWRLEILEWKTVGQRWWQ